MQEIKANRTTGKVYSDTSSLVHLRIPYSYASQECTLEIIPEGVVSDLSLWVSLVLL